MKKIYLSLVIVAFLCMAGWAGYAQTQPSNTARQKFEYKLLVYVIDGRSVTLFEDAKPLPAGSVPIVRSNELGAQGWELIAVTATDVVANQRSNTYSYWFKRPK